MFDQVEHLYFVYFINFVVVIGLWGYINIYFWLDMISTSRVAPNSQSEKNGAELLAPIPLQPGCVRKAWEHE